MIWVSGRVIADEALSISVLDRTFEHGLGLFETFRTWRGRAPLLDRHLSRLIDSAASLGIPIDPDSLPDDGAVSMLLDANRSTVGNDALVRITLTGGISESAGSTLWMTAKPLPTPSWTGSASVVSLAMEPIPNLGPLARFKSLNYLDRRRLYEKAISQGFDEALLEDGRCPIEGSRTNLFAVQGQRLRTPSTNLAIVPGIMRGIVMEAANRLGMIVEELDWGQNGLESAEEVFLTNSVRGIIPVGRFVDQKRLIPGAEPRTWIAPGRWTNALQTAVSGRLSTGKDLR